MKTAGTLIISFLLAAPVFADGAITVFGGGFSRDRIASYESLTPGPTYTPSTKTQTQWNGEIGVAASHALNQWWSAEASIAYRQSHSYVSVFVPVGAGGVAGPGGTSAPVTLNREARTFPIDASMRFHFANGSRWKPYVSAGARFVNASNVLVNYFTPDASGYSPVQTKRADNRLSAEVGAGLTVMLTRRFGLRGDVKRLLRSDDSPFDPLTRTTYGMEWKF